MTEELLKEKKEALDKAEREYNDAKNEYERQMMMDDEAIMDKYLNTLIHIPCSGIYMKVNDVEIHGNHVILCGSKLILCDDGRSFFYEEDDSVDLDKSEINPRTWEAGHIRIIGLAEFNTAIDETIGKLTELKKG